MQLITIRSQNLRDSNCRKLTRIFCALRFWSFVRAQFDVNFAIYRQIVNKVNQTSLILTKITKKKSSSY